MADWGQTSAETGIANAGMVFGGESSIHDRMSGEASPADMAAAQTALDRALSAKSAIEAQLASLPASSPEAAELRAALSGVNGSIGSLTSAINSRSTSAINGAIMTASTSVNAATSQSTEVAGAVAAEAGVSGDAFSYAELSSSERYTNRSECKAGSSGA
jgi:hypothetical protein